MQWFDLKGLGGKLERSQESSGAYYLKLTFAKPADTAAIVSSALEGWVANEDRPGVEFRNYRDFSRTSTIVAALESFFERDQLIQVKTDASKLRQGEELLGFTNPIGADVALSLYPDKSAVALDLTRMLDASKRDRILARVSAAQDIMGMTPAVVAFEGRGVETWHKLAAHTGYHDATAIVASTLARAWVAGESYSAFHDSVLSAAETGERVPLLDRDVAADRFGLRLAAEFRRRHELHRNPDFGWDEAYFYRGFMREVEANFDVWDGKALGAPQIDPESYGTKFVADPAMPASWKSRMFMRASMAIEQSAQMIGISPKDVFGDRTVFHMGKRIGLPDALGYHRGFRPKVDGEMIDMRTIKFTPSAAGVIVHEMGHAVDLSHRRHLKVEDAEAILLDDTGIRIYASWLVDQDDSLSEGTRAYLKSPKEIIARSYEAALADHMREKGDAEFLSGGGAVALNGGFDYAPHRDLTSRFVKGLNEVMSLTRKYRLEADEDKRAGSSLTI